MAVNTLLGIGNSALFANQTALNVTGNNIANVDTEGYSRQTVRFDDLRPQDSRPGQIGQGVYAAEIYRNFNRFVENSFLNRFTQQQRWSEQSTILQSVQSIFNEANTDGISAQLSEFFASWSKLASKPEDEATRQNLLTQADNLAKLIRNASDTLANVQNEMDDYINQSVNQINTYLENLRKINKQIASSYVEGVNTPNSLYDERDKLVRSISELIDVRVVDNGPRDFQLFTAAGQPLLQGEAEYSLQVAAPFYEKQCQNFDGELTFSGSDSHEYTLEMLEGNKFRVSLDGGKSWLRDENGAISTFDVPPAGEVVKVKNLEISFANADGSSASFVPGDKFTIVPKTNVQWCSPTREPLNITPESYDSGEDNPDRICGGKLAAYFSVRDYHVGRYQDKLDALTSTLIWEVNSLHSQGSGLEALTNMQGTYGVEDSTKALGDPFSTLTYKDKLTSGSLSVYFYNAETGESLAGPNGLGGFVLNFSDPYDPDNQVNFDPSQHSLEDVARAINQSFPNPNGGGNMLTATIQGGKLHIVAADGVNFKMGADSTGLMAALGLNTFFQGDGSSDISLNPLLLKNPQYVNAHSVDGMSEGNEGDGIIAARIAQLATKEVTVSTMWENSTGSMTNYYSSLVGLVGSETQTAMFNESYNTSLAEDLDTQSASISGVNLDEEMTNLIKFQHSYTAAAKLITTADQMLETILGLKQ